MATKRARIAVIIDADGIYGAASGYEPRPPRWLSPEEAATEEWAGLVDTYAEPPRRLVWVEADVPLPERAETVTVEGEVTDAE